MLTRLTKTSRTAKVVLVVAAIALLVPVFFAAAQDGGSGQTPATGYVPPVAGGSGQTPATGYVPFTSGNAQAQEGGASVTGSGQTPNGAFTGGVTDTTSVPNQQIPDGVYGDSAFKGMLYSIVVNLFGSLITWAGWLLNWAINDFVIGFGGFFNTTGVGVAVNELWSLVRDFFNILFIFGFIWIGFQMILDSGNSRAKQTLVSLIMAALLVNFSLFISKFVVDFSNRLASEVAIAAFPADDSVFDSTENIGGNIRTQRVNVADTFFAHMGIAETLNADQAVINNTNAPWSYIFGSAIFYLIAAFVFAAGGVMLMIRFVALSIFMVLSPFMFLGWVFPGMQGWTSKYWKGFLGRAFYAPVYIVLLFFAGTILQNFFGTRGSMTNDFAFGIQSAGGQQTFNPLISILGAFALSCAFLIAAVQVAGKMSADGAGGVMKVGSGIVRGGQRRLKNGAIGVGRFGARNTAGLVTLGTSAASDGIANSRAYRRLNAGLGNNIIGRNVAAGMDATLAAGGRASVAGSQTAAERRQTVRDRQNQINTTRDQLGRASTANENLDTARANANNNDLAQRAARTDAVNAVGGQVRRMTDEEILALDEAMLNDPMFAQHLTDAHITALRSSGRFDNDQMRTITTARDRGGIDTISETLDSTNASADELNDALDQLTQSIQRMPIDRLQSFTADAATASDSNSLLNPRVASNLTEKQIDDLQATGRFTATQIRDVRTAKASGLNEIANGTGSVMTNSANSEQVVAFSDRRERLFQGSAQQAGQLPADIFTNPAMAQYITPAALQQRVRNGLSSAEVSAIETNIRNYVIGLPTSREAGMWENWSERTTEGARFNF